MIENIHQSVLLKEVIDFLDPKPGETVLDATINGGGHSKEIVKKIMPGGFLVGIDQDEEILKNLNSKFQIPNSKFLCGNFRDLDELLKSAGVKKLDAVLFDLGMSSYHIDKSGRGFSFQKDEPLIMNYKTELSSEDLTARQILNTWPEKDIYEILKEYGEERYARGIAKKIVEKRKEKPFKTTFDLVEAIGGYKGNRIHPATRTFQALRIAVNDELGALEEGLSKAWSILNQNGRMAVISFHSLEDRMVKNFFKDKKIKGEGEILTKKPIIASYEEIKENSRARSAKLRAIKKRY